jgi:alcohol dehydrogenase/propanol-preferring alcohol dehydrogenase
MKRWSIVENDRPLKCLEYADPVPTGTEVLVEVTHCGVCHSDLHFWKGSFDLGGGRILRISDRGVKLPFAPGHEIVGRVAALGPESRGVAIGDQRIVYPWIGCGECEMCRTDRENFCSRPNSLGVIRDGGFGSHVTVPNVSYLFDYDGIDPALAATFACSGLTVYSAIQKLRPIDAMKPILLIGAGGLGLAAIAMLRALGFTRLISVDIGAEQRAAALRAGATHALDGSTPNAIEGILAAAGGALPAAIDFVNNGGTASLALECLAKGGKLVLVGVGGGDLQLSLAGLIFRPRSIIGSNTGSRQELRELIALARAGSLDSVPVTRMPKDAANRALELLKHGQVVGRLVLV